MKGIGIGEKIRKIRMELCLTQSELAGGEMNRSFISQIESGTSVPSIGKLEIIAERLHKPLSYFLETSDSLSLGMCELEKAELSFQRKEYTKSIESAKNAITHFYSSDDKEMLISAHISAAKASMYSGDTDSAWKHLYCALEIAFLSQIGTRIPEVFHWSGCCAYLSEEYALARRHFYQAIQRLENKKRSHQLYYLAKNYYASACARLGYHDEAIGFYLEVCTNTRNSEYVHQYIDAGVGLGSMYYLTARMKDAEEILYSVLVTSKRKDRYQMFSIKHNLAIVYSAIGRQTEAERMFLECLSHYKETQQYVAAASIMEEISLSSHLKGHIAEAKKWANDALGLLSDHATARLQIGRLHRHLGSIALVENEVEQCVKRLEVALAFFQSVHAYREVEETLRIRSKIAPFL